MECLRFGRKCLPVISWRVRWWSTISGLAMLVCLAGCDLFGREASQPAMTANTGRQSLLVKSLVVRETTPPARLREFSAPVEPFRQTSLAFSGPGIVSRINIDLGATVAAGDVLASLNTEALESKKNAIEVQVAATQQELQGFGQAAAGPESADLSQRIAQLRAELTQIEQSQQQTFPNEQTAAALSQRLRLVEQQIAALQSDSRQQVRRELNRRLVDLQGELAQTEAAIQAASIRAPFAGVVTDHTLAIGAAVNAGRPMVSLAELERLLISVPLPPDLAAGLQLNQIVGIRRGEDQLRGTVTRIAPAVEAATQTREVVVEPLLEKNLPALRSGERVVVQIQVENAQPGLWVPLSALSREYAGLWSVYRIVVDDDTPRIVREYVDIVAIENERVLVEGDLEPGATIVSDGLQRVVPGQIVSLSTGSTPATPAGEPGTAQ